MKFKAIDEEADVLNSLSRCEALTLSLQISPITESKLKLSESCQSTNTIGNKLKFSEFVHGNLTYDLTQNILDTSYIKTDDISDEGPYFFYFQADYD